MSAGRLLALIGGVMLLLTIDILTRRGRYADPRARPARSALIGACWLMGAWLVAAYFRERAVEAEHIIQAAVLGTTWFAAATGAGMLLRRSANRPRSRRR